MPDQNRQSSEEPTRSKTHNDATTDSDVGEDQLPITPIEGYSVVSVRIDSLVLENSPRLAGENPEHTRLLADADTPLPPILVHRPTMRVIDGMHRVRAALLNGKSVIQARLLDCDENTAFVLAVNANITHGLPLPQADRNAAAIRIIASHPEWSDRAIAAATGLSNKTVSGLRSCSAEETTHLNTRRGRDGRLYPLSTAARRRQAAAMINDRPEAGLREIARATGLSPATVRDVRQRNERGEDPVPPRYRHAEGAPSAEPRPKGKPADWMARHDVHANRDALLERLRNDPSLKFSEAGRHALRWLHHHTVDPESLESLDLTLPDHCATIVVDLARSCAAAWTTLAEKIEQRTQEKGTG